jgi:hypothetical protein
MTLSTKQGFPLWLAIGMILRGGTLAEQGQGVEGMAQMREGLAGLQAMGQQWDDRIFLPCWPRYMGEGDKLKRG